MAQMKILPFKYIAIFRENTLNIFFCKLSPISTVFSGRSVELKCLDIKYIFIYIMVLDLSSFVSNGHTGTFSI